MNAIPETSHVEWVKSSYSNTDGGECVEWAPALAARGSVPVRDSKDPDGPALHFTNRAWADFVAAVRTGDLPTV